MNHQSQADLVAALVELFPDFEAIWAKETIRSGSLHSVYMEFLPFISGVELTPKQLKKLAALLNAAVAAGADAENAVDTCFFEHLGRGLALRRSLRKFCRPRPRPSLECSKFSHAVRATGSGRSSARGIL